jgi:hypothetical protein
MKKIDIGINEINETNVYYVVQMCLKFLNENKPDNVKKYELSTWYEYNGLTGLNEKD